MCVSQGACVYLRVGACSGPPCANDTPILLLQLSLWEMLSCTGQKDIGADPLDPLRRGTLSRYREIFFPLLQREKS